MRNQSDNFPSGTFVVFNSMNVEGGMCDGDEFGLGDRRLPTLVFQMPLRHDQKAHIQFVFADDKSLFNFKKAVVELDMAAIFPDALVATVVTGNGTFKLADAPQDTPTTKQ